MFLLKEFQALGTLWYIEVFEPIVPERYTVLVKNLEDILIQFDDTFSRFKKDSLLRELNLKRIIPYNHDLGEMIRLAEKAYQDSDGIFSLWIEDVLLEKGYGNYKKPTSVIGENTKLNSCVITDTHIYLEGDTSLDLGGIGKGYLIDKLSAYIRDECGISGFLINGGGDIYVTHQNNQPVELLLQHPLKQTESIGNVLLKNQALCCSSSYVRMWEHDGIQKNHFVTKDNKEVWAASFVVGASATIADMAATVLCITSKDQILSKRIAEEFGVTYLVYDESFNAFGDLKVITS